MCRIVDRFRDFIQRSKTFHTGRRRAPFQGAMNFRQCNAKGSVRYSSTKQFRHPSTDINPHSHVVTQVVHYKHRSKKPIKFIVIQRGHAHVKIDLVHIRHHNNNLYLNNNGFSHSTRLPTNSRFISTKVVLGILMRLNRRQTLTIPFIQTGSIRTVHNRHVHHTRRKASIRVIHPIFSNSFRTITANHIRVITGNIRNPMPMAIRRITAVTFVRRHHVMTSVMIQQFEIVQT